MGKNKFEISRYHEIAEYIETGSKSKLSEEEIDYLDILIKMNSMRRRYGINETISFFNKKPYEISLYRAKQMFEESINLFYSDETIEKRAARNLKAEQFEQAAQLALDAAQTVKDLEIYRALLWDSYKARQLDQPDPINIPKELYERPIKIYTMNPAQAKLPSIDRNALAAEIDALDESESDKKRWKQEAMVEDIDFIEMINDQADED
ncbi:MAG: hypothetical protein JZU47_10975 [Prolixibacteraceae bacterium]|nr:hypothetical protein [Prolixibacteraceae bacterium]